MTTSRRSFLKRAAALGAGMTALGRTLSAAPGVRSWSELVPGDLEDERAVGLGPLQADPEGLLELPEGFSYTVFSRIGETMDDGLLVPGAHDGMAAFPGKDGLTYIVRNHELEPGPGAGGAFGASLELLDRVDAARVYDLGNREFPGLGGTTTLVYDTREQQLLMHWLSLAGTTRNCAGGATPWGSWVSCEEAVYKAGEKLEKDHGYCFEVPADHQDLVDPVPIKAMGRMNHEAIAVDPRTNVVYLTEDREDSLVYRYLPNRPSELHSGGKLQALRVNDAWCLDTRNWHRFSKVPVGEALPVSWVKIANVESHDDDLRYYGFDRRGAARFARGEGIAFGNDAIWFTCTAGGVKRTGQIWKYVPSPHEGTRDERDEPGRLELFLEPNDASIVDMCDNLTVAPWGDLVVAEDGGGSDRIFGVTPDAQVYPIARNALSEGEVAGPTFSPDGTTLFFNIQWNGLTLAVTGPWDRARKS